MRFLYRSYEKELLDGNDIPFADIERNMHELNFINTYLGGHAITVAGVQNIIARNASNKTEWLICEIGCGGGDNIRAVHAWCRRKKVAARFIGIDINPQCIAVATDRLNRLPCTLIASDYRQAAFSSKPDIIFSSLFCHHFTNEELVFMLGWMKENASSGFFINDLHRHRLAYYSIRLLTALFSSSYLVKNDAPLSVRRGFIKREWTELLAAAGITTYTIQWKWAFRHLVTAMAGTHQSLHHHANNN